MEPSAASKPDAHQPSRLPPLDRELTQLREAFPGWRIWYVPHAIGPTRWCAQRLPLLGADSPAELGEYMREVDEHYSTAPYEDDEPAPAHRGD